MALTTNFSWDIPDNAGDADTWGVILIAAFADVDADAWAIKGTADGALQAASNLSDVASASTARTNLGLVIGTDVQAYHANLAAFAGLTIIADKLPYGNGTGTLGLTDFTSVARTLLAQTTQALMRSTGLGLGAVATLASIDLAANVTGTLPIANGGVGATTASGARTALGVVPGTDVQTQSAKLQAINDATWAADKLLYTSGTATIAVAALTSFARTILDDADAATARATLGVTIGSGGVQAYDALLNSISGLTFGADNYIYGTGADTAAAGTITAFGRSLVDDASASAARTTLELGTAALKATGTSGSTVPLCDTANTWGAAQGFTVDTTVDSKRIARMAVGAVTNTGLISVGTAAPGALATGEIYLRHA